MSSFFPSITKIGISLISFRSTSLFSKVKILLAISLFLKILFTVVR